jgi:molecular chaperone DnaK
MSVVGIDLGTTNTVVACVRVGRVHVLADEQGHRLLPSVVSFHPNGNVLVGHEAKARRAVDARNTIASVKRLLGRSWNSPELAQARQRSVFEMREGPGQGPLVVARGQEYTLPEISAFVLRRAKQLAETALGEPVERAVITVPAHFNELQRAATKVAGRVAGLEVLRILNEPTAAALAYGLGKTGNERIAVYDFGGGTFDCTLLDLNGNVFEVLATAGDPFLGGDDLDTAIAERMADAFLMQHRFDPRADPQVFERLRQAAEQVKIDLSTQDQSSTHLREVAFGVGGAHLDLSFGLSRHELEQMVEPLLERTFKVTQDALALARLTPTSFDRTILVGGSTRIPLVRRRVEAFFGAPPMDRMNPDEVVAIGAAIQAAALSDAARRRSVPPPPTPFGPPGPTPKRSPSLPSISDPDITLDREPIPPGLERIPSLTPLDSQDDIDTHAIDRGALPPIASAGAVNVPKTTARGMSPPPPTFQTQPLAQPPPFPTPAQKPPSPKLDVPSTTARMPSPLQAPPPTTTARMAPPMPGPPPLPKPVMPPAPPPSFGSIDEIAPPSASPASAPSPLAATVPSSMPPAPPPPMIQPYAPPSQPPPAPLYQSQPPRAPVFTASMPPPVLIDVTPRALVVETVGGFCDVVIPRNAKIPCERTRQFSTARDQQTTVRVRVGQGEDKHFGANTYLGEVELSGLRIAARGEVSVAVTFELDADGTLRVRALDPATGHEAAATLQLVGLVHRESEILKMAQRMADTHIGPHGR